MPWGRHGAAAREDGGLGMQDGGADAPSRRAGSDEVWAGITRDRIRGVVVDINDGIVATAGVLEGFLGAGASPDVVAIGVVATMVGGAISLGGSRYAEASIDRDARDATIAEERRRLALSPGEEFEELVAHYVKKGLNPRLAREVAGELTTRDPLEAAIDAKHGIDDDDPAVSPTREAVIAAGSFAVGGLLVVLASGTVPSDWRVPSSFVAVALSLGVTSIVLALLGRVPVGRTMARSVAIGLLAMAITYLIGTLLPV